MLQTSLSSSAMNADTMASADSRREPPGCCMQAVSYAMKMLQACSPISQCILDGQLSKAQQLLEKANSQWHPASKSASQLGRCCSLTSSLSPTLHETSLFCCTKPCRTFNISCLARLFPSKWNTSLLSSSQSFFIQVRFTTTCMMVTKVVMTVSFISFSSTCPALPRNSSHL